MSTPANESGLRAVVVVVLIAAVCAAGLAFVKIVTADRIREAVTKETLDALQKVVPDGCSVSLEKMVHWPEGGTAPLEVYPGFSDDNALCGLAVKVRTNKGYSGKVVVLAGFTGLDAVEKLALRRIYVVEHAETPGLGSLITRLQDEPEDTWGDDPAKVFGVNFQDKLLAAMSLEAKKGADAGENDVVAVTAATISSVAVSGAVATAAEMVKRDLEPLTTALAASQPEQGGTQ
jgi:RnfABCDGE-type electron transport complex G subunit